MNPSSEGRDRVEGGIKARGSEADELAGARRVLVRAREGTMTLRTTGDQRGTSGLRHRRFSLPAVLAGAVLLLSSTVHPWYVTWMVALTCVEWSLPWLAFSAFVLVSYAARVVELQTGVWVDAGAVRWMEYAPLFGLLLVDSIRRRR